MRRGYLTTEFWLAVAFNIGNVAAAAAGVLPPKYAALAAALSVAAFNISRGLAKGGNAV